MLGETLTCLTDLRGDFGQPDRGLDSFDLAEEQANPLLKSW